MYENWNKNVIIAYKHNYNETNGLFFLGGGEIWHLAIVSALMLLGWPLVGMSWSLVGYNFFHNGFLWLQVKRE